MPAATPPLTTPHAGRDVVLTACAGLASAMGIGRFAFTPMLPLMQQQGQITAAQGAWLAAANYLGYLLGALVCARAPLSPAATARAGLLGVAVCTLAMGVGGGVDVWLAWRLLAGAASALALVGVSAWALEALNAAQRPGSAGAVFAGVGAGIAAAGALCLEADRLHAAAPQMWRVLGLVAALVACWAWPRLGPAPQHSARHARPHPRGPFNPRAVRLIVAYGAFGFGYILPATFLPAMARQYVSDPSRFGLVWPAFGLAALASTLLASRVARGFEPRRVWIAAQLVMACGVAAPALAHSLGALLTSAVCVGGTFMVVTMAAMQQARQLAVHDAPRLMGAMTAAFAAGQLLGPLTVGPLVGGGLAGHDTVPWAASALAVAALCAGVAVLCPRAPRTHT